MTHILNKLDDVDPNNSESIKETLNPFFQRLGKHTGADCGNWLSALEDVINRYPKYCMAHRAVIEIYLVHFLDSDNYFNVVQAGKCAHVLQQVRISTDKSWSVGGAWRAIMTSLCSAAHSLLDALLHNAGDSAPCDADSDASGALQSYLSAAARGPGRAAAAARLRNVMVFIQAMLVEAYPAGKPLRPQSILEVVVRALGAARAVPRCDAAALARVKVEALNTLRALYLCAGSALLPCAALARRGCLQALRWAREHAPELDSSLRIAAYDTLRGWLQVEGAGVGGAWVRELTSHVRRDVTRPEGAVLLQAGGISTKHLSKKAKRKLTASMLRNSNLHQQQQATDAQAPYCAGSSGAAARCAARVLRACGDRLPRADRESLEQAITSFCWSLLREPSLGISADGVAALQACRPSPGLLAALQHCSTPQVSSICRDGLQALRERLHRAPPTLQWSPSVATAPDTKRHAVSERNKAALQNLLGSDRMPQVIADIDIQDDEPTKKKIRIDSEPIDNISVSSESNDSDVQLTYIDNDDEVNISSHDNGISVGNTQDIEMRNIKDTESTQDTNIDIVDSRNIHNVTTQLPVSSDKEDSPRSQQVTYDYRTPLVDTPAPQTLPLSRPEDDPLPSTADTDDDIACGQDLRITPDDRAPAVNGFDTSPDREMLSGPTVEENVMVKIPGEVSVEEMLADFVDEVNEVVVADA